LVAEKVRGDGGEKRNLVRRVKDKEREREREETEFSNGRRSQVPGGCL
jgi:hypothetical protein